MNQNAIDLEDFLERAPLQPIDRLLARTIVRLGGNADLWPGLAAALVSCATDQGHVCLDLNAVTTLLLANDGLLPAAVATLTAEQWCERLAGQLTVGRPGDFRPLILDGSRLYLHRHWYNENELAGTILERCRAETSSIMGDRRSQILAMLFPDPDSAQRLAVERAVTRRFSIISGGPGSGKTYTIGRIIVLLKAMAGNRPDEPCIIRLAAPTGKAAARLQEAVEQTMRECEDIVSPVSSGGEPVYRPACTLHRLLGYSPDKGRFTYGADNFLPADAVIVDEASMIDLDLMASLVRALAPQARLVLVGDKDQLASVEAGALLGDMCHGVNRAQASERDDPPLRRSITVLDKPYRFDAAGGIASLSRAVNAGDAEGALELFTRRRTPELAMRHVPDQRILYAALEEEVLQHLEPLQQAVKAEEALAAFNRLRILAVVRQGPWGVVQLNALVQQILRRRGWIASCWDEWYPKRPVMITRNDYTANLFNGDVGLALENPDAPPHAGLQVVFSGGRGKLVWLSPEQLPVHETVYAMTVHKSQGSEFERVVLVLPDQDLPLLTRELLYTAVTRARGSVAVWGSAELLATAVKRRIRRFSGLREALWGKETAATPKP